MSKNELDKKQNTGISVINMEADAGGGFEQMGQDDLLMPFLRLLQKTSPQVEDDNPDYIEGAKVGMFFITSSKKLLGGSIKVIPCAYERTFLEWVPKELGGGLVGLVEKSEALSYPMDEKGRFIKGENYIVDTRNHYVLAVHEDGSFEPCLMNLTSTQIKKSRDWNTMANNLKIQGSSGKFTPPIYSHIYSIESQTETKNGNTWKGYKILPEPEAITDVGLYQAAKDFASTVNKGEAKVDFEQSKEQKKAPVSDFDYNEL